MIEAGHYILVNSADHDCFQVCRAVSRLTRRRYLVASVCPDYGEPNGLGMYVLDVRTLAQEHQEWGSRGRVFETWEQVEAFVHMGEDDGTVPGPALVH